MVYHLRPPTRVVRLEPAGTVAVGSRRPARAAASSPEDAVACRASGDPITRPACRSSATTTSSLARCRPEQPQDELFRNADADEVDLRPLAAGACLHTMFGPLPFRDFDYVVIPRCTTYRLEFEAGCRPDLLVIEAAGNVSIPARISTPTAS